MYVNHNNEQHAVRQYEHHHFYRLEVVVGFKMTGIKKQFQVFIIQNPTHQYSQANSKYKMHMWIYKQAVVIASVTSSSILMDE